jgi:hypothetical protein
VAGDGVIGRVGRNGGHTLIKAQRPGGVPRGAAVELRQTR